MKNDPQAALFHERIEDAMDEVIRNIGGRKKVAVDLWPDKPMRDAHNLIDHCLSPDRREKFAPSQVLYLVRRGREVGCHALINFLNAEGGYATAVPIEPEDELAELQRTFMESVKVQSRIADRIESMMAGKPSLHRAA